MYNDVVQQNTTRHIRFGILLVACIVLAKCSAPKEPLNLQGTKNVLPSAVSLSEAQIDTGRSPLSRPAALLGLHITQFLSRQGMMIAQSAVDGVLIHLKRFPKTTQDDQSLTAIETLGTLLRRNIADMLNQSTDRRKTLNTYMDRLQKAILKATIQSVRTKEEVDRYTDEYRLHKSRTRDLSGGLKRALRDLDYALASQKQQELGEARALLAGTQAQMEKAEGILEIYEELIPLAQERLTAIGQNREVIVAGLRVIEVPGIEDLGIFDRMR